MKYILLTLLISFQHEVSICPAPHWIFEIASERELIFSAEYTDGVGVYKPEECEVERILTKGNAVGVHISDNFLYVAEQKEGVEIFTVKNLEVSTHGTFRKKRETTLAVKSSDGLIFLAQGKNGLLVLDRNWNELLSFSTTPFPVVNIKVTDTNVFFLARHKGIYSLNKTSLVLKFTPFSGWCYDFCFANSKMFVACGKEGLKIINAGKVVTRKIKGWISAVDCNENILAVGLGNKGVKISLFKTGEAITLPTESDGWVSAIKVVNNKVIVGEAWKGIRIIKLAY